MAIQLAPSERNPQRIVDSIRELNNGRHNAGGVVTLTPGATSTVVNQANCSIDSFPQLTAATANAAAALATTFISVLAQGSFTISHANNAQADRRFYYLCGGG